MHANDNTPQLISLNEAARLTSLSRTMLNRYRSEGRFPAAIPLGDRRIAFVRQEVMQWIADKIEAARATTAQQPQSPWDDPTFSISGKSIYRTRGFIDTAA